MKLLFNSFNTFNVKIIKNYEFLVGDVRYMMAVHYHQTLKYLVFNLGKI